MKAYMPGNIFRWNPGWFEDEWAGIWGQMWGRTWWCTLDPTGPNFEQHLVPGATIPLFARFYTNWF